MRKLTVEELNRQAPEIARNADKAPVVLVLDSIRSALNVGSVFRTSDAFAIGKIYLCGITACPPHREIHKTALGATETVAWEFGEDIKSVLQSLRQEGYCLVGVEQTNESIPLNEFHIDTDKKYALVLGNEVDGVSDEALSELDYSIELPQFGSKHSLNVSVCAGIVAWEFSRKLLIESKRTLNQSSITE